MRERRSFVLIVFHRSWVLITRWGRRTLYVSGMGTLSLILIIVGILNVSAGTRALWPSGGLCVLWLFVYSLTIGPLAVSTKSVFARCYAEYLYSTVSSPRPHRFGFALYQ